MPTQLGNLSSKIGWSMASKAADKSNSMRMLLVTFAVSVLMIKTGLKNNPDIQYDTEV